ncbi:hypothetical protein PG995_006613 [Apiospora arundinis]
MDQLPPEIKGPIIRLAIETLPESENRALYATVSREWRDHAEPALFETITINTRRLSEAHAIMTPTRLAYVRQINLEAFLPEVQNAWTESEERRTRKKDKALFLQLSDTLNHINRWKITYREVELYLRLRISEESAYDEPRLINRLPSPVSLPPETYRKLPAVDFVTKFRYYSVDSKTSWLRPKACCEIASRFPQLRSVEWDISDILFPGKVVEARAEFAVAVALIPESVRDIYLDYSHRGHPMCYNKISLIPAHIPDPFGLALRQLSKQLEKLTLFSAIGREFFPDSAANDKTGSNNDGDTPLWPYMREIRITADYETAQGIEYFDDIQSLDIIPIHGEINRLHLASSRAAARMPNLEHLSIEWGIVKGWAYTRRHEHGAQLVVKNVEVLSGLPRDIEEKGQSYCLASRSTRGRSMACGRRCLVRMGSTATVP